MAVHDSPAIVKSVGEVTAPLLAGFSFTNVIVVSSNVKDFVWPGEVIFAWTLASLALITAVQFGKYGQSDGQSENERAKKNRKRTTLSYHIGIVALLAGFGCALVPNHIAGMTGILRLSSCILAFAACAIELYVYVRRYGRT
jgi:hypothetical protein